MVQRGTHRHVYTLPGSAYVAALLGTFTAMNEHTPGFGDALRNANVRGTRYVRPEHLRLGQNGVPAIVNEVRFLGSHYEVTVICEAGAVTVLDLMGKVNAGERVAVGWSDNAMSWLI
jgi:hypothetical protein